MKTAFSFLDNICIVAKVGPNNDCLFGDNG